MRAAKELYQLVLKEQIENPHKSICQNINALYYDYEWEGINDDERIALHCDFSNNYPSIFSKFWWNEHFTNNKANYWWTFDDKGQQQRIKFLQHIISKL